MKSVPLVSFIVPIYNVELYLEECLQSIYAVVGIEKEVILIDDGSTDSSPQIMGEFAARHPEITVAKTQKNAGQSEARNVGLRLATGCYISFVDSDDFINPKSYTQFIEQSIGADADIVHGNGQAIWGDKWQHHKILSDLQYFKHVIDGVGFLDIYLRDSNHIVVWDKIYKRTFLLDNNIYFLKGLLHEDVTFLFTSFLMAKSVVTTDINFYLYRQREGSIMHTLDTKSAESRFVIVEYLLEAFNKRGIKNRSFYDYLVYQLWRARETSRLYNRKLTRQLMGKPISLKKITQCLIMLFKK